MKYLERAYQRYKRSSKRSKGKILDELCAVCQYNRKYAIWKLNQLPMKDDSRVRRKRVRRRLYGPEVTEVIEKVWEVANYPWSVRLKEILRLWLPWIKQHFRVSREVEEKLLRISASTIDRALREKKRKLRRRLYGRTKPGTLLRHQIPLRTDSWDVNQPGFMEVDLVSHCGGLSQGEFIYSLNLTDVFSGWVETEAIMGKGQLRVIEALERVSARLPFKILGLDSDNGSEFINHHLYRWCEQRDIQFTRSRPYKKDDNAHIEQKNWTHVRKFMGWDRYDSSPALQAMNSLYRKELSLFMNLFQPSVKLIKTLRHGSRKLRLYDQPQTPADRLINSGVLPQSKCHELKELREKLDPFSLSEKINQKLEQIWALAHHRPKSLQSKETPPPHKEQLSPMEKETLASISQAFGITIFIKTHPNGELVAIHHG